MRCPRCKNHVVQKVGDAIKFRIQGPVIVSDGVMETKCYWCGAAVEIPLGVGKIEKYHWEKLVVREA